jgi:uncharacterized protein YmfQ (DUF2313 family)
MAIDRDRHVRRTGDDYTQAMLRLLPTGQAWPRSTESTLVKTVDGLCQYYGFIDSRAGDLLERESDPRITIELLPDWEKAWGLPDPCFPKATTVAERQRMLVLYMTWLGGQSRAYYSQLMEFLGFSIEIKEFAPFMAGVSQVGDTRPQKILKGPPDQTIVDTTKNYRWYIGPPELRFYWSANVGTVSVAWFRAASGQAGVDPHCRIGVQDDLQCLLNRWKPAHTDLVFDFSTSPVINNPMYGTP